MEVFKNIYKYRELLKTNVKKEIRGKYKNSVLGILWSFLNPLLQIIVYTVVFQVILKNPKPHYIVFLCAGLIPWNFFSIALSRGAFTFIENGNIIKKVYFPREIIPISVVTSEAVNFIISTIIILAFALGEGMGISKYFAFYPIILIIQYIFTLGLTLIVSAITVYFRDLQHLIGVALQLLFYATPIVFAADVIPEGMQWIIRINPMSYIINGYRDIFYNQTMPDLGLLGIMLAISVTLCIVGYLIFNKLQKGFAEQL